MKIMGAVAGLPTPAADWAQTDPERSDYIHNKPDVEAIRSLAAENENGQVTVYAFGGKPAGSITLQATITEVQK